MKSCSTLLHPSHPPQNGLALGSLRIKFQRLQRAFTLIELLVGIAIIAIRACLASSCKEC